MRPVWPTIAMSALLGTFNTLASDSLRLVGSIAMKKR